LQPNPSNGAARILNNKKTPSYLGARSGHRHQWQRLSSRPKTEAGDADLPKEESGIMAKSAEYEVGLVIQGGNTEVTEVADGCTGHTQKGVSTQLAEAEGREAKASQAHLV
jgi:hypothetical protein